MKRFPVAFGHYVITRSIARGGMAQIFRARTLPRHGQNRNSPVPETRWVALKLMRSALENRGLPESSFPREAKISQAIRHNNVVSIYDYGEELERHYLAMEYVGGKNIEQLAPRPLLLGLRLYIASKVAKGLGYARVLRNQLGVPMGIVHRDISPKNIMIGFNGAVNILDFGVARMNETNGVDTQKGTLRGKHAYMSLEQVLGARVDARSDVFAFGIVLYELMTGINPFKVMSPLLVATVCKVTAQNRRVRSLMVSRLLWIDCWHVVLLKTLDIVSWMARLSINSYASSTVSTSGRNNEECYGS